ncbi:MAG: FAD-dependent oxidoreductase [Burkholderiaceae bacterium]|nr:FAD-dependent oxidoreductase [Burkholderiaceae bacterium]
MINDQEAAMASQWIDRRPSVSMNTDVLVVGGGAAGLAAACTAASHGLKVMLLERYGFCGGAAVAGLSGTVCGLYLARPGAAGKPEKVVHGFVDRFIETMDSRNGLTGPVRYGDTWTRVHEPLAWRESADELLEKSGVQVLLHTTVIGVHVDGGERVTGVRAYTKQGPFDVKAKVTIDASGDADLFAMAGLDFTVGADGKVQNPTMIFRIRGVDVERFLATYGEDSILPESVLKAIGQANQSGKYKLPRAKIFLFPTPRPNELLCNSTRVVGHDGSELHPLVASELTEAEIEGRRQVREYERFYRATLAGCENAFVNDTGVQVGVRQTRQIVGMERLTNEAVERGAKTPDAIARSPWPIELHSGTKPRLSWLHDDFYEIPLGCFIPRRGESLLATGRSLSAEHEAMASARVTAQCFSYGHAIGHAAAIAVREKLGVREIKASDVRELLRKDGAQL